MQEDRAVRVDGPLGVAGRARGVAHARRVGLRERRPRLHRPGVGQQRLVVQRARMDAGVRRVLHDDHVLDRLEVLADGFEGGPAGGVHDQDFVAGVVDDVGDVGGREPDVDGVQHGPHARRGEVDLEMAVRVPREGSDPVALAHAEGLQRAGQPCRPLRPAAIVHPLQPHPGHARGQRFLRKDAARPLEEVRQRERVVHDQVVELRRHRRPPGAGKGKA